MNIRQITYSRWDAKVHELDSVILLKDCPDQGLMKGDMGAVVMAHAGGKAFEVEFVALTGDTLGVLPLSADEVRPRSARDSPHVRVV